MKNGILHTAAIFGVIVCLIVLVRAQESKTSTPTQPLQRKGLKMEQLKKTSVPLMGFWKEQDPLIDDEMEWIGSTCVATQDENFLYLLTNRHCLGIADLFLADGESDLPEILDYSIKLHFPENVIKEVRHFGWIKGAVDLAFLVVNREGLQEGRDYVLLKTDPKIVPVEGMDAVVVGSPFNLDLKGTHTFGKVSAIRSVTDEGGNITEMLQTDAAINHGNSGGPVFLKAGENWAWAGVATLRMDAADNIGIAIRAHTDLRRYNVRWFLASPKGCADLLKSALEENIK